MEKVVLVDEYDNEVGVEEKMAAHLQGKLHRAVSVFLFNAKNQLLIQQRAHTKYHSGGLWSNTCCSHPRPGESPLDAAERRLWEEMGIRCELQKIFDFVYKVPLDHQIMEYEFDHVFIGEFEGEIHPNPEEVCAYQWVDIEVLQSDMRICPERYTFWFKEILTQFAGPAELCAQSREIIPS